MSQISRASLVKSYFYKATGAPNGEMVYYVVGFKSKARHFKVAITKLQKLGYDVLAFEYDPAILSAGDPQYLIDVINDVTDEVGKKAKDYKQVISMGASLGAFIAFDVQKRVPNAYVGAYGTACVGIVNTIFGSRVLRKMGKVFVKNGFDKQAMEKAWDKLEVAPGKVTFPSNKSFVAFDGTADRIVSYKEAKQNIELWRSKGIRGKMYTVRGLGHTVTVINFMKNTKKVIVLAKQHHLQTQ